jgi:hypothetical protein
VLGLPDLRDFVRAEPAPQEATILVRGGPDTSEKLTAHAERLRRRYVLDGEPVLGISVFAALDDIGQASLDGILSGKLATYRLVHLAPLRVFGLADFVILPTFGRPHMTVVLRSLDWIESLLAALGPTQNNPHYAEMVRRRRGDYGDRRGHQG